MNGGIRSSTGRGGSPAGGFTRPEGFDRTLSGSNRCDTVADSRSRGSGSPLTAGFSDPICIEEAGDAGKGGTFPCRVKIGAGRTLPCIANLDPEDAPR